ncbi:Ankyrin-3 [Paramyrothecium foliicola]|nr:Ankyrin-3 [Paramyrothecium foliicola]
MSGTADVALLKRIDAIAQTISELCARATKRLGECSPRQSGAALGALVAELYFLGDAWRRLRKLIAAKGASQETQSDPSEFTLLAECESLLRALEAHLEHLQPDAALELQAAASDYRKSILRINACDEADDIYRLLSEFQGGDCCGLSENLIFVVEPSTPPAFAPPRRPSPSPDSGNSPPTVTESKILAWIDMLLSLELSREPEEYYQEEINLQTFRARHPDFSTAATQLPRHTETFWPMLKPFISFFFKTPGPYNWVHWVLEYARETWPDTFGPPAFSRNALLDLTEDLCDGSLLPLHFAAALGLPSLCEELVSIAKKEKKVIDVEGKYGTPLFCALVGPRILKLAKRPMWWSDLVYIFDGPKERAATISLFLDAGSDCKQQGFQWQNGESASYLGLALWASLATRDETILQRVLRMGAQVDGSMPLLLQNNVFREHGSEAGRYFVTLLTILFDELLLRVRDITTLEESELLEAIDEIMTDYDLKFSMIGSVKKLERISDQQFYELVHDVLFLEDTPHVLRRLALDPRFDPNQAWLEDFEPTGTLLHMAVSGDLIHVVEVLLEQGADKSALDEEGRTPLMLAESTEMLAKLINVYGDTTTSTDYNGRNIWHYAAASNDGMLLRWLSENDPYKAANLRARTRTTYSCTPAAEAFMYINEIAAMPKEPVPPEPTTARLILKECLDETYLQSDKSLAHVAAAWGRGDLIEALVAAGVDFREIDENGRSALHHLNTYASRAVVKRLQELCEGLPIATDYGLTPAETMLSNTILCEDETADNRVLSAHPSCYEPFSGGFEQLLTPEVLAYKDYRGHGLWARFGEIINSFTFRDREMIWLRDSVAEAIRILATKGALKTYEEETKRAALYAMADFPFDKGIPRWSLRNAPLLHHAITNSDAALFTRFCKSEEALQLFLDAVEDKCTDIMYRLASHLPLHSPRELLEGRTLLEYVIEEAFEEAHVIVLHCKVSDLIPRKVQLKELLDDLSTARREDVLKLFANWGCEDIIDEMGYGDWAETSHHDVENEPSQHESE